MEDQIDWDDLFDDTFLDLPSSSSPDHQFSLSLHDVEQLLLKDNDEIPTGDAFNSVQETADGFFDDILLDSPLDGERSGEVVDVSDGGNSTDEHKNKVIDEQKNESVDDDHKEEKQNSDDDPNDPLAKKRKRQLRNKDAALKSRERKKMYVKDLEMKSRYYEAECKRLGSLLQCFMAENQALRYSFSLQTNNKAYNASMTKQESAVLFLESLLLGSLLWLIGIVCQLVLHHPSLPQLQLVGEEVVPPSPSPSLNLVRVKVGSEKRCSLLVGKEYKASRSRMRMMTMMMPINMIGLVF